MILKVLEKYCIYIFCAHLILVYLDMCACRYIQAD